MTVLADNMAVALSAERLELRPGDSTEVEVTVRNSGQTVEHYSTSVVGLPRGARYTAEPAISHLMPGDAGTVKVRISLPDGSDVQAGRHVLGMLVRSPYHGDISRCEEFDLHVVPVAALTMTAHPQVVVGGWSGRFALNLTNSGNTPLSVGLTCTDPEDAVLFSFRPKHPTVAPGGSSRVRMNVRATRPWTGSQVRRALTVRAKADPDLAAEQALTFVQRPQLAAGLLRVLAMALGVAVMAAAVIIGALLVRHKGSSDPVRAGDPTAAPPGVSVPAVPPGAKPPADGKTPVNHPSDLPPPPPDPNATIVDFSRQANGEPAGDRIIQSDEYAKSGITLTSDTQVAPTVCKDATAVALRTNQTLGSFLTSARPAGAYLCNTQPIRITFTKPAKQVQITYSGLGGQYKATLQLSDGTLQQVTGTSQKDATPQTLTYTAKGGVTVLGLVFGHASPDPNAKDPTIIKRLVFTPAR
jgi:hypothetical protein